MVEVVVAFTQCDDGSKDMIARRIAVIKRLVPQPVSEGVDAESGLLHEEDTENPRVDEASFPVAPAETRYEHGEDETHHEDYLEVVAMLPDDNGIFVEVGDVGTADAFGVLFHDHPAWGHGQYGCGLTGTECQTTSCCVTVHVGLGRLGHTKMRVEKTLSHGIGVLVGIGIAMVGPMVSRPPSDRSFDRSAAHGSEEDSKWQCGGIRRVCPQTMIPRRDP